MLFKKQPRPTVILVKFKEVFIDEEDVTIHHRQNPDLEKKAIDVATRTRRLWHYFGTSNTVEPQLLDETTYKILWTNPNYGPTLSKLTTADDEEALGLGGIHYSYSYPE